MKEKKLKAKTILNLEHENTNMQTTDGCVTLNCNKCDITHYSVFLRKNSSFNFQKSIKFDMKYISCHWNIVSQTFFLWSSFGVEKTRYIL
jgi:hypothetical protein